MANPRMDVTAFAGKLLEEDDSHLLSFFLIMLHKDRAKREASRRNAEADP